MGRRYNFNFPVVIPSFNANLVPPSMKDDGIWDYTSQEFKNKFLKHGNKDVQITKTDLDNLPNPIWAKFRQKLQIYA